jgi:hypothetical protein
MCLVYKNVLQYIYMYKCVYVYIIYIYVYVLKHVCEKNRWWFIHISKNKKIYSGTKCVDMDDIYIYIDIAKKTCVYVYIYI